MKYTLKHPIKIPATNDKAEYEIKELNLVDRMKAKHAKLIPDATFKGEPSNPTSFIPVIASMAGIEVETAEEIDFIDLVKIMEGIVTPFLSELK